ncbi:PAQR family membrane homeostasis protein TrhA [Aquisphaera insulae]|uniref:PAQR family membrane homeostasis protein TrhA n=1 Tax=Aquisphaera insulae TaxID=2712864 RepID=UPI0013EE193E|nr:hemolysin III family protein [Aquisphaera insulae]
MPILLREPLSSASHGIGFVLAVFLTWTFWRTCSERVRLAMAAGSTKAVGLERGKLASMLVFGLSMMICYGCSSLYHGATAEAGTLARLRRLDHVGIYLLIAGTYTPGVWCLMHGRWRSRTLQVVWTLALCCSARIWMGGVLARWASTMIYLGMGWGVLLCYGELARSLGHRALRLLPIGGAFYSVGAVINLTGWPAPFPGVFGAHEVFHLFVIAGTASHAWFMIRVAIPAAEPVARSIPPVAGARLGWRLARLGGQVSLDVGETLPRGPSLDRRGSGSRAVSEPDAREASIRGPEIPIQVAPSTPGEHLGASR